MASLTGVSVAAGSVVVDINSVSGEWTSVVPPAVASGVGTNQITWGTSTGSGQSGYRFDGVAPPRVTNVPLETRFNLGTFTHFNFPVTGTFPTSAVLDVTIDLTVRDGFTQDVLAHSIFTFNHTETPNATPCQPGSISICDDMVTFAINPGVSDSFEVDGVTYFVDITSFIVGSNPATQFLTQEGQENEAMLQAMVTATPGEGGGSVQVPAPPPLALVGLGFGVTALARGLRPR